MNLIRIGNRIVNLDRMTNAAKLQDDTVLLFLGPYNAHQVNSEEFTGEEAEAVWSHLDRMVEKRL